jgi:Fe-S-cluster containining protein
MSTKQQLFSLYDRVYDLTAKTDLPCLSNCDGICERDEAAYFLPHEDEYIIRRAGLPENSFPVSDDPGSNWVVSIGPGRKLRRRHCPFSRANRCQIHAVRPLDCRSFPIAPVFDPRRDRHPRFVVYTYCPIHEQLPRVFVRSIAAAWELVCAYLPKYWWDAFNDDIDPSARLLGKGRLA